MPDLTVVKPKTPLLDRLVSDYLASGRARGLSPKTIRYAQGYPLRGVFLPWCAKQDITEPAQLTTRVVERFQTELLDVGGPRGPLARTTVWSYVKAVRGFIDWMRSEGEEVQAKVRLPRQEHKVIEVLERDEIDRLEAAADSERDKLIVRVLADTGMRVGELVKLRDSDLGVQDRRRHYLKVRRKGSRERLVPIDAALAGRLNRYITRTRPGDTDTDRLFVSRRRTAGGAYQPITESGIQQMVRDLAERAGIKKRVHPHLFRHSAATYMLQRGMNPLSVAHVLGHTNLAMIERVYAHLTFRDDHQALIQALRGDGDD